jgi:hypothetical protein
MTFPKSAPVTIETNYDEFIRATEGWGGTKGELPFPSVAASALFLAATLHRAEEFSHTVRQEMGLDPNAVTHFVIGGGHFREQQVRAVSVMRRALIACSESAANAIALGRALDGKPAEPARTLDGVLVSHIDHDPNYHEMKYGGGAREIDGTRLSVLADEDERTG